MKYTALIAIFTAIALIGCGGKPTTPESPDPSTYGQTIKPDHKVPEEHRDNK